MFPFPKLTPPALSRKIFIAAALIVAALPALPARADDCKPKIDKQNLTVELGIPGYNGGHRIALTVPLGSKEGVSGGGAAGARFVNASTGASFSSAADVAYNARVTERRDHGAMLEINVMSRAASGAVQTTKRAIYIEHDKIVEQIYLTGVSLKAGFKVLPFKCKK